MSKTPKDAISEGIAALTTQLEAGNSAALKAHLSAMGRFHSYSFGNQMLIALQCPTASHVAGFHAWKGFGRSVRKGAKAIRILAPMVGKNKDVAEGELGESRVYGFRSVCVFDISQTEGDDLPGIGRVSGDAGGVLAKLECFAEAKGIAITYTDSIAPALGMSYGGRIELLPAQPHADTFVTLAHELAHELLHKTGERGTKTRRELEAEAVAFIVGTAVGLDMGSQSADYVQLYGGNAELLRESMEAISRAAREILAAVLPAKRAVVSISSDSDDGQRHLFSEVAA
jgi:antirestriction factor ArdC-like protein